MLSLLTLAQQMRVEAPDGYTQGEAEQLEATYAAAYDSAVDSTATSSAAEQFAEVKTTVIAIMNESFSDLSLMDGLGGGVPGPHVYEYDCGCRPYGKSFRFGARRWHGQLRV